LFRQVHLHPSRRGTAVGWAGRGSGRGRRSFRPDGFCGGDGFFDVRSGLSGFLHHPTRPSRSI
jgi:hypothetical protein